MERRTSLFKRTKRLLQGLAIGSANGHGLTNGFHSCCESGIRSGELLESEPRDLYGYIVKSGFKTRGCNTSNVVWNLIERITEC